MAEVAPRRAARLAQYIAAWISTSTPESTTANAIAGDDVRNAAMDLPAIAGEE